MKAYDYICIKQIQWALNHKIPLIGSKGTLGQPAYTKNLDRNLFEPLEPDVEKSFLNGDGNEIKSSNGNPAKMQALHSSSALGVNIFQYWQKINRLSDIAAACKLCRKGNNISKKIVFEDKYPIDSNFKYSPNIDVVFHNSDKSKVKRFAIECKFSEPYSSRGHSGLQAKYLVNLQAIWKDIPYVYNLAKSICPDDNSFVYLHSAQLIKHILGLKKEFGKNGFRLLYLWYDVPGEKGAIHRKEIQDFSDVMKSDNVKFHAISYQELIITLAKEFRNVHNDYITYIVDRYL